MGTQTAVADTIVRRGGDYLLALKANRPATHDALVRLRSGSGPENVAVIRHCAMNLLRIATDKHGLKVRRKQANLDAGYLAKVLARPTPLT